MLIYKEYRELVDKENKRQLMVNAITVVETNKYSKTKQFKDIEMFKEAFEMYDFILNEYEEIEPIEVNHKTERQNLFGG